MVKASLSFSLNDRDLRNGIQSFPDRLDRLVTGVVERQVDISTGYMKQNAPWRDRTGNARNTLHAVASHSRETHVLTLAHGMPYGIWLELKFGGRDAIIYKSVITGGVQIMKLLNRGMARL